MYYERVVDLCKPYMGPAAGSFIDRICSMYLKVPPAQLQKANLVDLARWVEAGGLRFMEEQKAKELAIRVAQL